MSDRLTYWDYIKLDEIHHLQSNVQTNHHDEVMFIAVHQHFELWFAQIIRELKETIRLLMAEPPQVAAAAALMERANLEFACANGGFDVMKTLPRESFLAFRDALRTGSGLQSAQLTIIELLVGRHADEMYHDKIKSPGMIDFREEYGGDEGLLAVIARERKDLGTLRTAYDRVAGDARTNADELAKLTEQIVAFDRRLAGWRKLHYDMAATVLGADFTSTEGTIGNKLSCRDNLQTGMHYTHRYFADLDPNG